MIDLGNYDHITLFECIGSACGTILLILPILQIIILYNRCRNNILDGKTLIVITETCYSNDNIELDFLKHSIDHT